MSPLDEPRELTVKLIPRAELALLELKIRRGWSEVDTINRAIQVYQAIDGYVDDGGEVRVFDPASQKTYTITIE